MISLERFKVAAPGVRNAVFIGIVTALALMQFRLAGAVRDSDTPWIEVPAERDYRWSPVLFNALTFGHGPTAVDWLLLRFLIEDPAYVHVQSGIHPPAYYDLDLATSMDPAFFELYAYGANLLAVIRSDGAGARDLLLKGERFRKQSLSTYPLEFRSSFWDKSWAIPFNLGYVYMFELQDIPRATEALKEAALIQGSPGYLKLVIKNLSKPGGRFELGLTLIKRLLEMHPPANAKTQLERQRFDLEVQYFLYQAAQSLTEGKKLPLRDPWGGQLSQSAQGKVVTTTPHENVF